MCVSSRFLSLRVRSFPMASSNNTPNPSTFDQNTLPNTTFVQADPSTFRAVVQRLTGAAPTKPDMRPRRPPFKLHERRATARKLEIKLTAAATATSHRSFVGGSKMMASPVSPLEYLAARGSPRSPMEEEERAIAEKGYYLHPSPLSTPRGSDPPELLPLFPLRSPRDHRTSPS